MEPVLFQELEAASGKKVAIATLNAEKSLNALSLPMVQALMPQLLTWQQDDTIAMVMLQGAGEKAFCAGGDIRDLYFAMKEHPGEYTHQVETFFAQEYQLDYLIHTYDKPILLWGQGIVMGGGLGLMAGASHRVVTESSRIAMPEITIGLYPDVGGTWFLNRMPGKSGLFLGLTGASINAADAKYIGLADHFVSEANKAQVMDSLLQVSWGDTQALNHQKLADVLREFERVSATAMPKGNVQPHQSMIDGLCEGESIVEIAANILGYEGDDKWLNRAKGSLAHGSPTTAHIVFQQLQQGQSLSLEQCFQMELSVSVRCGQSGEFAEGVRALLIEKDNQPKWAYSDIQSVPESVVQEVFTPLWSEDAHPLKDLGAK